jgi:glyoxylase-like metal-dependent hydrolase (beta-lactamase superfamily II)
MFFKQMASKESTLSYFFGCGGLGKAVAVDVVAGDEAWFIEAAREAGVEITHVIDTHVHADHYSGGRDLARQVHAPYCLHESNQGQVKYEFLPLQDGQRLEIGNVEIEVLHTPGHTPDSLCLLVTDKRRGAAPWFVLTGDTLFVGAIGRPDLAGREFEMAGVLYDSLHSRLLSLPDEVEIYPGHQAGSVCGAGLSGKPASTLGFERRWNPALTLARADFVDNLTREIPPRPAGMEAMLRFNLGLTD